ncbi:type IVB secretion system apparatus protein IcmL/DotI [Ochrobactrum oryzae]|nr:type IVB secretion system apparatus protein IcmL/DotI [Brucella oryzae]
MSQNADYGQIETILMRADVYRTAYRRMSIIALALLVVAVIAVLAAVSLALTRPEPRYFATTADGRIQPLIPLDQPHLSAAEIATYAAEAVTRSFTYSFATYQQDFQDAQQYFTKPQGWNSFVDAVQKSGTLELVKNRRLNTTAIAQRAVIVRQYNGVYEWIVQMPVRVTYQSASEVTGQNLMVTITLQRLQSYEHPRGAAISRFLAAPEVLDENVRRQYRFSPCASGSALAQQAAQPAQTYTPQRQRPPPNCLSNSLSNKSRYLNLPTSRKLKGKANLHTPNTAKQCPDRPRNAPRQAPNVPIIGARRLMQSLSELDRPDARRDYGLWRNCSVVNADVSGNHPRLSA